MIKILPLINLTSMVVKLPLLVLSSVLVFAAKTSSQPRSSTAPVPLATWIIGSIPDSVTLCTAYSIPFDRIFFVRSGDTASSFSASLTFSVDATDSATGTNFYRFSSRRITASTYDVTRSGLTHAEDYVTLTLPRSSFRIRVELHDDRQNITYLATILHKDFSRSDSSGITSIVFLDSLGRGKYYPVVMNNTAPFPEPLRFVVICRDGNLNHPSFSLLDRNGATIAGPDSFSVSSARLETRHAAGSIYFSSVADSSCGILFGRLNLDTLREGTYSLEVFAGRQKRNFRLSYSWLDKPFTLRNLKLALPLLEYIVPDSVYSEINSGNDAEKREKLEAYWRSHDPTPSTAYNELEAQYYDRADYALRAFATVGNPNGAATDRGKAYILYGKPQSIRREFRSDGTYETWKYTKLKRILVFREQNYGDFKLYETEKL